MDERQLKAKDLASMLNMSTASISFVLNGKPGVSEKTRKAVLDKIRELGCEYLLKTPEGTVDSEDRAAENANAFSNETGFSVSGPAAQTDAAKEATLKETRYHNIGFVVYKRFGTLVEESPFFKYLLEGISLELKNSGYDMKFIYMNKADDEQASYNSLVNSECDGFIIFAVEMKADDLDIFIRSGLPFVVLDNSFQTTDVDCVSINNQQGISKAVSCLYKKGHRRIGYIRSVFDITSFTERFAQYRQMLEQYHLPFEPDHVIMVGYSEAEVEQAVTKYLSERSPVTAYVADNDLLGCYALNAFKKNGCKVPADVSIIGFDNRPICTWVSPPLTTIDVPQGLFGPEAARILIDKIDHPRRQSLKIHVGVSLIQRESVSDLNGSDDNK